MKNQQKTKTEWKEVELGEICEGMHQGINTVVDKINYTLEGYPIIQSKHITKGFLDFLDSRFISAEDFNKYKDKYSPSKNDILICNIGTIGKSIIIKESDNFLIAWNLFLIKIRNKEILSEYIKFYLDYLYIRDYYSRFLTGGTVKFVNKTNMKSIKIPLPFSNGKPDLKTQKTIVSILEKAEKLKQKQKKQLELYDEYLKSVFYEMFLSQRDDSKGPKEKGKWEEKSLGDVCEIIMGQSPAGSSYNKNKKGVPFFQGKAEFGERHPKVKYWTTEPSKIAEPDSILMSVRAPVGSVNVCNIKCCIGRGLASIKPKEGINLEYLFSLLQVLENKIADLGSGSTFKAINSGQLRNLKIPLPPLPLQKKFANIVEKVEKLKEKQKKSLEDSEELFNVLMQKGFKGGLG